MSTFTLYRTVILFIMHFVRDVFNLPHLNTPIDLSKSLNTTHVNNYSYKMYLLLKPDFAIITSLSININGYTTLSY